MLTRYENWPLSGDDSQLITAVLIRMIMYDGSVSTSFLVLQQQTLSARH